MLSIRKICLTVKKKKILKNFYEQNNKKSFWCRWAMNSMAITTTKNCLNESRPNFDLWFMRFLKLTPFCFLFQNNKYHIIVKKQILAYCIPMDRAEMLFGSKVDLCRFGELFSIDELFYFSRCERFQELDLSDANRWNAKSKFYVIGNCSQCN